MLEPEDSPAYTDEQLDAIYRRSPVGAFALAGISTLLVFLLWLLENRDRRNALGLTCSCDAAYPVAQ